MKKFLTAILVLALGFIFLTACSDDDKEPEPVLPAQTISVSDGAQLADIRNYTGAKYKNYTFELTADVDLSDYEVWTPIGDSLSSAFMGTFDGKGHTVTGLKIKGWDSYGNPLFIGSDAGYGDTTSFSAVALFGYTDSATFRDVKVSGIDFSYYVDLGYAYTAGLAAYNVGESLFENIEVDGSIEISNLYLKKKTFDNRGEFQNLRDECTTNLCVGGAVAYSAGETVFKNVKSSVNIGNVNYSAYYQTSETVEPDIAASTDVEEKYIVESSGSYANSKIEQVFAGGVVGLMKYGSLENAEYGGRINISAKNIDSAGIAAAVYGAEVKNPKVAGLTADTRALNKNITGGVAALADDAVIENAEVTGSVLNAMKLGSVQAISAGGIFGYICNLSEVKNSSVSGIKIISSLTDADVGGVGGVIRNAKLSSCTSEGAEFRLDEYGITKDSFATYATVVGRLYGNAVAENCSGSADNYLGSAALENLQPYASAIDTPYVNDDGLPSVRLFKKNSTAAYLTVYAEISGASLNVRIYDEELTLLKEAVYTRAEAFEAAYNPADRYLDVYFAEGEGFRPSDGGAIAVEGRNPADYEYRSGVPKIENLTVTQR